jgi:translation initiation factor IF-3
VNEQIRISPVRLIDGEGTLRGVVPTEEALRIARESGMDLVEVSPNERPPVCKVMDYGKFKYLQSKKLKQKHHEQKLKELRLRPKTDVHDKDIKVKRARDFLEHGDRVQFTMMFRGRERVHKDMGIETFNEVVAELGEIAKIEQPAKLLGRRMVMVLVPAKAAPVAKKPPKPPGPATGNPGGEAVKAGASPRPQPTLASMPSAGVSTPMSPQDRMPGMDVPAQA